MDASLAQYYDAHYAEARTSHRVIAPSGPPRDRYEACVRTVLERFEGGALLELGAGTGLVARSLIAGGLRFDRYVASDRSESALPPLAAGLAGTGAEAACLDAEQLPAELEGRFDAVLMVALIEHLVDPLRAMQAVRKLLRPGGFVYNDTPNIAKNTRRVKLAFGYFPATASRREGLVRYDGAPVDLHDEGHLHYFTYRSLGRMLTERCGFAGVEKAPYFLGAPAWMARGADVAARAWPEMWSELAVVARV